MRLIDYVKFVFPFEWARIHSLAQLADIVDTAIRCRVHFVEILITHPERFCQNARGRGLAGAAAAGKEIRMTNLLVLDRFLQYIGHLGLSFDLTPVSGAICPVECLMLFGVHAGSIAKDDPRSDRRSGVSMIRFF